MFTMILSGSDAFRLPASALSLLSDFLLPDVFLVVDFFALVLDAAFFPEVVRFLEEVLRRGFAVVRFLLPAEEEDERFRVVVAADAEVVGFFAVGDFAVSPADAVTAVLTASRRLRITASADFFT